jgi:manganese-dependent ADP-ribose/CDP-alcohol diphosphatase
MAEFDRLSCRTYHCIGNHELYNFSREQLRAGLNTAPHGFEYYAFRPHPGWAFLVLDPYQEAIIGWEPGTEQYENALAQLKEKNPNDVLSACNWVTGLEDNARRWVPYNGGLGVPQLEWLGTELAAAAAAKERVVVLSHVPLLPAVSPPSPPPPPRPKPPPKRASCAAASSS